MVLFTETAFLYTASWGLRAPHPGVFGGCAPPYPAVHFWTPKSEPKNRQNPWFWNPFSVRMFSDLEHVCSELHFVI